MSFYVVLIDRDFKTSPGSQPALPKVIAHNLSLEQAERMEAQLTSSTVEGHPVGWAPYLWEYVDPHAQTDPSNCLQCEEVVLRHCKHLLQLLEHEKGKRSP